MLGISIHANPCTGTMTGGFPRAPSLTLQPFPPRLVIVLPFAASFLSFPIHTVFFLASVFSFRSFTLSGANRSIRYVLSFPSISFHFCSRFIYLFVSLQLACFVGYLISGVQQSGLAFGVRAAPSGHLQPRTATCSQLRPLLTATDRPTLWFPTWHHIAPRTQTKNPRVLRHDWVDHCFFPF